MKIGSNVIFKVKTGIVKEGIIIDIIPSGKIPDLDKFEYLHRRGLSKMKPKTKSSFLISDGFQLYWPEKIKEV